MDTFALFAQFNKLRELYISLIDSNCWWNLNDHSALFLLLGAKSSSVSLWARNPRRLLGALRFSKGCFSSDATSTTHSDADQKSSRTLRERMTIITDMAPIKYIKGKHFQCPNCLKTYRSKTAARRHVREKHEQKSMYYWCKFCSRRFFRNYQAREHEMTCALSDMK